MSPTLPGVSRNATFGPTVVCLRALWQNSRVPVLGKFGFRSQSGSKECRTLRSAEQRSTVFLGRSRVTSRDLQRVIAGMVARSVYARTNDKHWGAFLPHRSKLWGLPNLSQALDRGELVRSPVRSIDSKGHFSNTFVFLYTCGVPHAKLAALDPQARSPGRLL